MKILQLHNAHAQTGGASYVVEREQELLASAGHDVRTFLVHSEDVLEQNAVAQGAAVLWNRDAASRLRIELDEFQPDVAHLHTPFPFMSLSVLDVLAHHRIPVVMTHHAFRAVCVRGTLERSGVDCELCVGSATRISAVKHSCFRGSRAMSGVLALSSSVNRTRRRLRDKVAVHLVLTEFGKDVLVRDGFDSEQIRIHPNFVPDPGLPDDGHVGRGYLFAGRLVPEKGVRTLLAAWAQLGCSAPNLQIAGAGELESFVQSRTDSLNCDYLGLLEPGEIAMRMRSAKALVFPSEWKEGIGLAWIESIASSTPVIYSDVGNFSDILDRTECGLRFSAGDPVDLANTVREMEAFTEERLGAMKSKCRSTYVTEFSAGAALERLLAAYQLAQRSAA